MRKLSSGWSAGSAGSTRGGKYECCLKSLNRSEDESWAPEEGSVTVRTPKPKLKKKASSGVSWRCSMFFNTGLLVRSKEFSSFCPFKATGDAARISASPLGVPFDVERLGLGGSPKWKVVDSTVGENRTLLRRFLGLVLSSSSDEDATT